MIRLWHRFDRWLRTRAQQHIESDAYRRREKKLYDSAAAFGRAMGGWNPKRPKRDSD